MLELRCSECAHKICNYQKDGAGPLKRLYLDRMDKKISSKNLVCSNCSEFLGIKTVYKKENRPAYRLFQSSIIAKTKKST